MVFSAVVKTMSNVYLSLLYHYPLVGYMSPLIWTACG